MVDNTLVYIEYRALNNTGEHVLPEIVETKRGKKYDRFKVLADDYQYEIREVKFTLLFEELCRKTRQKIRNHVFSILADRKLVKNKKAEEYAIRFNLDAHYFEKNNIVAPEEMMVSVSKWTHINLLQNYCDVYPRI